MRALSLSPAHGVINLSSDCSPPILSYLWALQGTFCISTNNKHGITLDRPFRGAYILLSQTFVWLIKTHKQPNSS